MNFLLVFPEELLSESQAIIRGNRARTVQEEHELSPGITVSAALLGGKLGKATVREIAEDTIRLEVNLELEPPERVPLRLLCAIPRPQTVKKLLHLAASIGLEGIDFAPCDRTVPGYSQSKSLRSTEIQHELHKGLEQSGDTRLPEVILYSSLQEALTTRGGPSLNCGKFFAHTDTGINVRLEQFAQERTYLSYHFALGPEAGWSERESALFQELGFRPLWLGRRQYRVETSAALLAGIVIQQLALGSN